LAGGRSKSEKNDQNKQVEDERAKKGLTVSLKLVMVDEHYAGYPEKTRKL